MMSEPYLFSAAERDRLRFHVFIGDGSFDLVERRWDWLRDDVFRKYRLYKTGKLCMAAAEKFGCSVGDIRRLDSAYTKVSTALDRSKVERLRMGAQLQHETEQYSTAELCEMIELGRRAKRERSAP
jgi:hypothetical protein